MSQLVVFAPSSKVLIGPDVEAFVVKVHLGSNNSIQYRCVWWENGECLDKVLDSFMVRGLNEKATVRVGFK